VAGRTPSSHEMGRTKVMASMEMSRRFTDKYLITAAELKSAQPVQCEPLV